MPGFADKRSLLSEAERRLSIHPHPKQAAQIMHDLLAYRLIEGTTHCARVTRRGRAALKYHGRTCPDVFQSHCPDIFDPVSLLPMYDMSDGYAGVSPYKYMDPLPDTQETWHTLLLEYSSTGYAGRRTLNSSQIYIGVASCTPMALSGSLREHSQVIIIHVNSPEGNRLLDLSMSLEQFASALVGNTHVPVTVDSYRGSDGHTYSEVVPSPITPASRMKTRLSHVQAKTHQSIAKLRELLENAKLGVGARNQLLETVRYLEQTLLSDQAFVATQTAEEMGMVAESLMVIMKEQARANEGSPLLAAARESMGLNLLGSGE